MVLTQMVVDAVVLEGRSMREVAQAFGVSKSWVHKMVHRCRLEGPSGLEPRSRAHQRNPNQISLEVENRVIELIEAGVLYKHSRPYHPQTCGKVERWHQTLKRFLAKKPCRDLEELQRALNEVVVYYNEQRPHRSRDRMTPLAAFNARPRAEPFTLLNQPHNRIRRDVVDNSGKVTVRYLGAMRHLKVGSAYRGQRVRLYLIDAEVRIVTEDGNLIREATLDASKNYQPTRKPQME